jgi:hypothetical protein
LIRVFDSNSILLVPCLALLNLITWSVAEFTPIKGAILGPADRLIVLRKLDAWNNEQINYRRSEKDQRLKEESIIFISSSLGIAAANMADYEMYKTPNPLSQQATEYSQYRCLDQHIREMADTNTRTVNFSNVAAMISEDLLIAKEAVRLHGKPSLMILAIAPRDFLDHYTAAYHRSRLAQILISRQTGYIWDTNKSKQENLDAFVCKIWPYYSQRVEYRDLFIKIACESFNRSESLFSAATKLDKKSSNQEVKAVTVGPDETTNNSQSAKPLVLSDDLASEEKLIIFDNDYRGRYLPIDSDRWKHEIDSLKSLTQYCRDKKIPLLIVTMPITQRNQKLLPPDFLSAHTKAVSEIATSSSSRFLDLMADPRFTQSDFSDTVHLRSTGGIKLARIITDEIREQHLLP